MKKYLFSLCVFAFLACSPRHEKNVETVKANLSGLSEKGFLQEVSAITLLPLRAPDSLLIGDGNELMISDGEFYIVNSGANDQIFRFSGDGLFLNSIGRKGRGAGEYLGIRNAQIIGDTVMICSKPEMEILYYTKEGGMAGREEYKELAGQAYKIGEDYLVYAGYGRGLPERMFLYSPPAGKRVSFLNGKAKVLSFTENTPVFYRDKNNIFIRETYCDTVYRYDTDQKQAYPYLVFDFGKYAIGKEFFGFSDSMSAAEYFMSKEHALLRRYMENTEVRLAEVLLNRPEGMPDIFYGINRKGSGFWRWFTLGNVTEGAFVNTFRLFHEGKLYCLLEPYRLKNLTEEEKSRITNPQVLDSLKETDNFLIGVINFKENETR